MAGVALLVVALLATGSGQAASKADVGVNVIRGTAPGMLDWQLSDANFPGLNSVRFVLQGQPITAITCPSGWTGQVSPTSGATCSGGSLGPGQTMAGSFTFGGSLPPTAGTLFVGNASGTEQIPFTIAGGTPTPCTCLGIRASIDPRSIDVSVVEVKHVPIAVIRFRLHWLLSCSTGSGGECSASLRITRKAEGVGGDVKPDQITLRCSGPCGGAKPGNREETFHAFFSAGDSPRHELAGKRIEIDIFRECGTKTLATEKLSLAFDGVGRPDRKKSKLHP